MSCFSKTRSARSIEPALVVLLLVTVLLASARSAIAADSAVTIERFAFSPSTITLSVGDSITWTNKDPSHHNAVALDGSFRTPSLAEGASATVTFSTVGTFAYHCSIHPEMTGTIAAVAAPTAPATDTAAASEGPRRVDASFALAIAALVALLVAVRVARRPA